MALPIETNVRSTDVLADVAIERIGIEGSGSEFLKEALQKINTQFGFPFEVYPTSPAESLTVNYNSASYELADGRKLVGMKDGVIPSILPGSITFDLPSNTGSITSGTNLSFTIPAVPSTNFIKALVQFSFGRNALTVTFGTPDPVLGSASIPNTLLDYEPIALIDLYADGTQFTNIFRSQISIIKDTLDPDPAPTRELQEVTGSPKTVFTTVLKIPTNRSRLFVFVNGVRQTDEYAVNTDHEVQFGSAIPVTAKVLFEVI